MANTNLFIIRSSQVIARCKCSFLPLCFVMCIPNITWAQSENQITTTEKSELTSNSQLAKNDCNSRLKDDDLEYKNVRFRPYQPNNAVWQYTEKDEHSARVNYSFRYLITKPEEFDSKFDDHFGVYFSYTGQFDFYMFTRPSSPVVNRISNPAFHVRWSDNKMMGLDWLDVAIEHKSNGQLVSANAPVAPNSTQNKAAAEFNAGNHAYIDSISRSTNYFSLEGHTTYTSENCITTNFYLKLFAHRFYEESDVYWGRYAGRNVSFSDFERVRFVVQGEFGKSSSDKSLQNEYFVEWTVGDKGLATDSVNIRLKYPVRLASMGTLPLMLQMHFGPMNQLSNYTESQRSIGLGLAFYY